LRAQGFDIPAEGMWFWFEGMIDLFFYVDLALNFFTAFEVSTHTHAAWQLQPDTGLAGAERGNCCPDVCSGWAPPRLQDRVTGDLVTNHASIATRYLTGWFIVDLLATFPVDYIVRAVEVWNTGDGLSCSGLCSHCTPPKHNQPTKRPHTTRVLRAGLLAVLAARRLLVGHPEQHVHQPHRAAATAALLSHHVDPQARPAHALHYAAGWPGGAACCGGGKSTSVHLQTHRARAVACYQPLLMCGVQDDLYAILPALSILELVIVLVYLGHISGCFFFLLSTPPWQTSGAAVAEQQPLAPVLQRRQHVRERSPQPGFACRAELGSCHLSPHAGERALIASGEMTTWMQRAFGADRIIMLPSQLNVTTATGLHLGGHNSSSSQLAASLTRPLPPSATQVCERVAHKRA
jgi:hypothetical protein